MKIEELNNTIEAIMSSNKKARNENNYLKLIENGFACLEYTHKLINISVDAEKEYRKFEAEELLRLAEAGVKGKNGEAETKAKATEHYQNWQWTVQLINLCYEMVNVSKLLSRSMESEYKAMPNVNNYKQ